MSKLPSDKNRWVKSQCKNLLFLNSASSMWYRYLLPQVQHFSPPTAILKPTLFHTVTVDNKHLSSSLSQSTMSRREREKHALIPKDVWEYVVRRSLGKPKNVAQRRSMWLNRRYKSFAPAFLGQMKPKMKLVASALHEMELPTTHLPEVAFAGRSNCGKSTLLNELSGRHCIANVNRNPGSTQELNFYHIGSPPLLMLVDLPGYGFAQATEEKRLQWTEFMLFYLKERINLKRVLLLIDSRHGLQHADREVLSYFERYGIKWQIILTKADLVGQRILCKRIHLLESEIKRFNGQAGRVIPLSALWKQGLEDLRKELQSFKYTHTSITHLTKKLDSQASRKESTKVKPLNKLEKIRLRIYENKSKQLSESNALAKEGEASVNRMLNRIRNLENENIPNETTLTDGTEYGEMANPLNSTAHLEKSQALLSKNLVMEFSLMEGAPLYQRTAHQRKESLEEVEEGNRRIATTEETFENQQIAAIEKGGAQSSDLESESKSYRFNNEGFKRFGSQVMDFTVSASSDTKKEDSIEWSDKNLTVMQRSSTRPNFDVLLTEQELVDSTIKSPKCKGIKRWKTDAFIEKSATLTQSLIDKKGLLDKKALFERKSLSEIDEFNFAGKSILMDELGRRVASTAEDATIQLPRISGAGTKAVHRNVSRSNEADKNGFPVIKGTAKWTIYGKPKSHMRTAVPRKDLVSLLSFNEGNITNKTKEFDWKEVKSKYKKWMKRNRDITIGLRIPSRKQVSQPAVENARARLASEIKWKKQKALSSPMQRIRFPSSRSKLTSQLIKSKSKQFAKSNFESSHDIYRLKLQAKQ